MCSLSPVGSAFRIPAVDSLRHRTLTPSDDGEVSEGGLKVAAAVLQLFEEVTQQADGTIGRDDLEAKVRELFKQSQALPDFWGLFGAAEGEALGGGRVDFLSYWRGMDRLFAKVGARTRSSSVGGKQDVLDGMRAFRDGVLELWERHASEGAIPVGELLDLLAEVREAAEDGLYWEEVMRAVPREGCRGLSLRELARTVHEWLREHTGAGQRQPAPTPQPLSSRRRRSLSADACLGLVGGEATSSSTPRTTPIVTPRLMPWSETLALRQGRQRPTTLLIDGLVSPAVEMHKAVEFAEFLGQELRKFVDRDSSAQEAQRKLLESLRSLERTLHRQESDLSKLQSSNAALTQKREALEAQLADVREFHEDVRELQVERDKERSRAEALEKQLMNAREQHLHASEELEQLKAETANRDRGRFDTQRRETQWRDRCSQLEQARFQGGRFDAQRRETQWRDRCSQLEQAADTAEGQARWMSEELEQQRLELADAQEQRRELDAEVARLRESLREAAGSLRSYAAYAAEGDECAEELRRQIAAASAPADAPAEVETAMPAEAAGHEDGAQQSEHLELLRSDLQCLRDELLELARAEASPVEAVVGSPVEATDGGESLRESPRHLSAQRRIRFLESQVQALLRHSQSVERLLDGHSDSQLGPAPDVHRRLSIQRVHQEGEALFAELSERLHTLDVQKADADQEVQRLQAKIAELQRKLTAVQQSREELLLQLSSARHASVHDELQACLQGEDVAAAGGEPSATSETRSASSSGYLRQGDGSFFPEARGSLQASPKAAFVAGVNKVVTANFLVTAAASERREQPRRRGSVSDPGAQRQRKGREDEKRPAERKHRGTKKADGDCEMQ